MSIMAFLKIIARINKSKKLSKVKHTDAKQYIPITFKINIFNSYVF